MTKNIGDKVHIQQFQGRFLKIWSMLKYVDKGDKVVTHRSVITAYPLKGRPPGNNTDQLYLPSDVETVDMYEKMIEIL